MPDGFDIQFKLLPPKLQMQLWVLALDADTTKVNLAYQAGSFQSALEYNYGGKAEASLSIRHISTTFGIDPSSGHVDAGLGLAFRGYRFNMSAEPASRSASVGLGYGEKLLPFPAELSKVFNSGGMGLTSMMRDIHAAPDNPLAWYKLHSDDASAIGKAVQLGQQIAKAGEKEKSFGVGLRLNYSLRDGIVIYAGAQFSF